MNLGTLNDIQKLKKRESFSMILELYKNEYPLSKNDTFTVPTHLCLLVKAETKLDCEKATQYYLIEHLTIPSAQTRVLHFASSQSTSS